jgi:RNA polymerase sigma-70 factor (ECF subfamily)
MFLQKLGLVALSLVILGGFAVGGGVWASQRRSDTKAPDLVTPAPESAHPDPVADDLLALQTRKDDAKGDGARELSQDDGKMVGKRSIAGGGHAVKFEAPGDGWTLTAVRVHGARYGTRRAPREDFAVFLCDEKFQQIAEFLFPYSKFERGDSKWVTLEVKPTKLPRTFILGVDFDPTQTKGVYVSHDREGNGHSLVGLPGEGNRPFPQGDWLIRARIEPAREKGAK